MWAHRWFTQPTKMYVYLAQPPCPWVCGTTEHTHGLLRQCFPAGTQVDRVARRAVQRVPARRNDRPRTMLTWHIPAPAFPQLLHEDLECTKWFVFEQGVVVGIVTNDAYVYSGKGCDAS